MLPIFQHVNIWAPIVIFLAIVGGVALGQYLSNKDHKEKSDGYLD